jgi:RNA polymerase sigma-70 factor (ECF subfamily)
MRLGPSEDGCAERQYDVSEPAAAPMPDGGAFLAFYDEALPHVYGYLVHRCGTPALAEELTSESFLAAVDTVRAGGGAKVSLPWIIGVARHKLMDHWRRQTREQRGVRVLADDARTAPEDDPWDVRLDVVRARQTLEMVAPHHRAALTLRYLDDLSVPEVASELGRTVHATEALLVRARASFRRAYGGQEPGHD